MERAEAEKMTVLFEKAIENNNRQYQDITNWQNERLRELSDPVVSNKAEFIEDIRAKFIEMGLIDSFGNLTPQYGGEKR
ncbi:MAG: hypothetical protein LBS21_03260 [Clostridiales bacterium]|jgi:hypothetical protein|nr:hypothetical protein [Clostridiales bacterium]